MSALKDEITSRLNATGIPYSAVSYNHRVGGHIVMIRRFDEQGNLLPIEPKDSWKQRLSAAHLRVVKMADYVAEHRDTKPTLWVDAHVELEDSEVEKTPLQQLIEQAEALAAAKREADAAAERFKALEAAWKALPSVQAATESKKATKEALEALDTTTRALLEQHYRETGITDVGTPYYELTTTTDIQMTDAEQRTLVDWLVRNMPALAINLLVLDMKALEKMIHNNTTRRVSDDGEVTYGLQDWFAGMPVVLRPRVRTQINWSKLPKPAPPAPPEKKVVMEVEEGTAAKETSAASVPDEGYGDPYPTEDDPSYLLPPSDLGDIPF